MTTDSSTGSAATPHGLTWWLSDVAQVSHRSFLHLLRSPELLLYAVIQPIIFILLFFYVLGGAIGVPNYEQFLMPGILVQMVVFGAVAGTTVGVATDVDTGLMDRFRSMPMYRSAVLAGRTVAELGRSLVAIVVMIVMSLIVGFRFETSVGEVLAGILLLLLFGYAMSWLATLIGLVSANPEAAQTLGTMWLFPFTFISSAYVPTDSMPGWLSWLADVNPMTAVVDAERALLAGGDAGSSIVTTLVWSVVLIVVLAPLSSLRFGRRG